MRTLRYLVTFVILWSLGHAAAQQYTGITGLLQTPSAETGNAGDARIGTHFLNGHATPASPAWSYEGKPYNTMDFYAAITPFRWIEIAYTFTLFKTKADPDYPEDKDGYTSKDRYFSLKLQPLSEGRYRPAVAVGLNDALGTSFLRSGDNYRKGAGNGYWRNFYLAVTKHIDLSGHRLGGTIAYRYYTASYNHRWNGVIGGLTWNPRWVPNLRAVAEWTGCDFNIGLDCLLWKHLLLQATLQGCRYPSAGICYVVNLF